MEVKLKSILREPRLALALKSAIFGGFLALLKLGDFRVLPVLFFLWVAFLLSSKAHQASFLVFLGVAMATIGILDNVLFLAFGIALFSSLFYLIVGIKDLVIIHRREWSFFRNLLLFYAIFLLFFLADKSSWFLLKYLTVFGTTFFLLKEWILIYEFNFLRRVNIAALVLSSIILQVLWVVALLPLGPVNSANLMVLTTYILFSFVIYHFQGQINRKFVLKKVTIFVLLLLLIFVTSGWRIG